MMYSKETPNIYREKVINSFPKTLSVVKKLSCICIAMVCFGCILYTVNVHKTIKINQSQPEQIQDVSKEKVLRLKKRFERQVTSLEKDSNGYAKEKKFLKTKRFKRAPGDDVPGDEEGVTFLSGSGVTYVRWGRRECSGSSNVLIYDGMAAGSHRTNTGGTSDYMCLPNDVVYEPGHYVNGHQGSSYVYGLEYRDSSWINPLIDLSNTEAQSITYHTVPCAICFVRTRNTKLMIPGRNSCPDGWSTEYTGYIMATGHSDKHSTSPICVDDAPQVVPGTQGSQDGASLHIVETHCTSLLCEPYVAGRELRCAVCTL